ncbi:MAG: lysophospholipase [Candidatus Heimdallarchaeaceae archaeon]|nr:MAG: hypothetical protein DRN69_05495 [Candidatus Pacearchaeota archaeon]
MSYKEGSFKTKDKLNIFYRIWEVENPKGIVQIIHGFGEHSGRYQHVAEKLNSRGFVVVANDHRGHGKSEGIRNHAKSFFDYVEDEKILTDLVTKESGNLPLFILGHSMGSIIAYSYAIKYQDKIKGMILSGTGTRNSTNPVILNPIVIFLGTIAPKLQLPSMLDPNGLSYNKENVEKYINDPLVNFKTATCALGKNFITHYKKVREQLKQINIPILMQYGKDDQTMTGQEELFNSFGSKNKKKIVYENCKHEIYNEIFEDGKGAIEDMIQWIESLC